MKHKLFLFLAALGLLLPQTAFAYDFEAGGIYYSISGNEATVTYKTIYNYYSGSIVIPSTVTYSGTTYSVTSIGERAFSSSSGLTSVTIPEGVTSIGNSAFSYCSGLTSVTIPEGVTSIGNSAFSYCSGLTSVTIPNSVTSIGNDAFYYCNKLTSVTIPNSVTSIGNDAFYNCRGLTSITIPEGVTSIGSNAFYWCINLTSITIPNSVTSIGASAFYDCSGLTSITIPNSVESIGNHAFAFCSGLTSVTIPNSVESIGSYAFSGCSGLPSITIPNSVKSIGESVLGSCDRLTSIIVEDGNTKYDSRENCNAIIETATNTLIAGCMNTTIPSSVTSIGNNAFYGCSGLPSVTIPNSVTSIGNYAFYYCSGLTTVTIPSSVTSIGNDAFYGCSGLTSVTIGSGVTSLNENVFYGCSAVSNLIYAEGCTTTVRTYLKSITSVTIPSSVTSIGDYAFYNCGKLTSVTIPEGVKSIGDHAFAFCYGLTSVTIPEGVTSIGNNAFNYCNKLTSVTNLATVPQTISSDTFSKYGTLHVRKGYKDVYAAKNYWKNFTIVDDAIFSATLTDGEEYTSSTATDYDEVAYTRTFNNTDWQALYVPFSLNYNEWKDYFDIAEISTYAQYDDNVDGDYDRMNLVVEKLEAGSTLANHPYLIRAKSTGTKTLALTNKTLEAAETNSITCSSALGNYELTITGTYTEKADMFAKGYYALSGGRLMQANSASVVLKPQRWYIDAKALGSGVKAWKIVVEEAEGITAPSSSPKGESPVAYDLMGRSVKGGAKGISIVNGKKIIR